MTKTARLLRELVALPSVNPYLMPHDSPGTGEKQVADYLAESASRAGLDVSFQKVEQGRANLLVRLSPLNRTRQRVLLAPHLDTVPPSAPGQLIPKIHNGRLYGRGACDTKGSVAAMFTAILNCGALKKRPAQTEILFSGLVDEESGQRGSRHFAACNIKADLAIVGEPTRLHVITAHKGAVWLRLRTRGKAAHGARPDLGQNAILKMARLVEALETKYAAALVFRHHPLLGHATINVGVIRGGSQPNIVPDLCEIEVDRRTLPGETDAAVRNEIRRVATAAEIKIEIDSAHEKICPPLETNSTLPLVARLMAVAGQKQPLGAPFFCDAAILAQGGIPSVIFGPGDIAQAHTADEWIELDQVERAAGLLTRFLSALP